MYTSSSPYHPHSIRSSGFSLVEVLVSIVVLSIGLLGMVGMQTASLQANREAKIQSAAAVLARELAEMMRGNKSIAVSKTNNPYLVNVASPMAATTPTYCLNASSACTSLADVANAQMTEWLARVDDQLPGAHVQTCFDTAPFDSNGLGQWGCSDTTANDVVMIKIGWTRRSTDRSKIGSAVFENATTPTILIPVTAGASI